MLDRSYFVHPGHKCHSPHYRGPCLSIWPYMGESDIELSHPSIHHLVKNINGYDAWLLYKLEKGYCLNSGRQFEVEHAVIRRKNPALQHVSYAVIGVLCYSVYLFNCWKKANEKSKEKRWRDLDIEEYTKRVTWNNLENVEGGAGNVGCVESGYVYLNL